MRMSPNRSSEIYGLNFYNNCCSVWVSMKALRLRCFWLAKKSHATFSDKKDQWRARKHDALRHKSLIWYSFVQIYRIPFTALNEKEENGLNPEVIYLDWMIIWVRSSYLTLKMASAQVVETSVANNSPSQDSSHPDHYCQSRYMKTVE